MTRADTIHRRDEESWYPVDNRVTIRVPAPGSGMKKQWAMRHKQQLRQLKTSSEELLVYSDGSRRIEEGTRFAGAGAGVIGFR